MSFKQMIKRFFVELFDKKHQNYVAQQQQQALRSLQQISFWMQESLFISLQYGNYPFCNPSVQFKIYALPDILSKITGTFFITVYPRHRYPPAVCSKKCVTT